MKDLLWLDKWARVGPFIIKVIQLTTGRREMMDWRQPYQEMERPRGHDDFIPLAEVIEDPNLNQEDRESLAEGLLK